MDLSKVALFINETYTVQELLWDHFKMRVSPGQTFCCPFHADNRKSAKLYEDNAFWCFACAKQFTPYRILTSLGFSYDELRKQLPKGYVPKVVKKKAFDEEFYKAVVENLSKVFKRSSNVLLLMQNWTNVLKYKQSKVETDGR